MPNCKEGRSLHGRIFHSISSRDFPSHSFVSLSKWKCASINLGVGITSKGLEMNKWQSSCWIVGDTCPSREATILHWVKLAGPVGGWNDNFCSSLNEVCSIENKLSSRRVVVCCWSGCNWIPWWVANCRRDSIEFCPVRWKASLCKKVCTLDKYNDTSVNCYNSFGPGHLVQ